ncbi:hypothetical protein [Aestuariivivens sp. NBU2969]|uniref:hypothetical protein n=1 Tax=Aestuariivivens sp. NBU2969 TaxID=2873267 RepID=UPI001CBCDFCF|nr:hypothetical protein [Aestuariivivens sp. NBU2969]
MAPYIKTGVGGTFGSLLTYIPKTKKDFNVISMHIPVEIGIAIGRNHRYDLTLTYYLHNSAEQISRAAAIGFSFPLN